MPTADATLLPPAFLSDEPRSPRSQGGERASARHLEDVGVETILGAMIEQKRRSSQPSFPAFSPVELSDEELHDADEGPPGGRAPATSEVFLKAR